jgi:NADH-quinone oxidoreductase subunit E
MGSERLTQAIATRLGVAPGGTTADERFTLLPIVCLGACDHAPVLMVDDDLHHDVDTAAVDRLLDRYP